MRCSINNWWKSLFSCRAKQHCNNISTTFFTSFVLRISLKNKLYRIIVHSRLFSVWQTQFNCGNSGAMHRLQIRRCVSSFCTHKLAMNCQHIFRVFGKNSCDWSNNSTFIASNMVLLFDSSSKAAIWFCTGLPTAQLFRNNRQHS